MTVEVMNTEGTEAEGGKGKVYLLTDCMVYEIHHHAR